MPEGRITMLYFNKPESFNGPQFVSELRNVGIDIVDEQIGNTLISYRLIVNSEGQLGIDTDEPNQSKIQNLLNVHIPIESESN